MLAKYLKIKTLMLTATFSLLLGSLLYGIGAAGEMLIVGRILQGVHFGGGSALLRIYIGETSNIAVKLKGEDKAKSQIKNTNFFLTFSLATLGVSVGPGGCSYFMSIREHCDGRVSLPNRGNTLYALLFFVG